MSGMIRPDVFGLLIDCTPRNHVPERSLRPPGETPPDEMEVLA